MKKTLSSQSLLNLRRPSLQRVQLDDKKQMLKTKVESKPRIPSPNVKNQAMNYKGDQIFMKQHKKKDIQQIYQYKIKQRSNKTKPNNAKQEKIYKPNASSGYSHARNQQNTQSQLISLHLENQKMSKQLLQITRQNKRLKQMLLHRNTQNHKQKPLLTCDTYKKSIVQKLNQRQRVKTQAENNPESNLSNTMFNTQNNSASKHKQKQQNDMMKKSLKKKTSKNSSRKSITMNVNMSFVKVDNSSQKDKANENQTHVNKNSSNVYEAKQIPRCHSTKSNPFNQFILKSPQNNLRHLLSFEPSQLFNQFSIKKSVNLSDLQRFNAINEKMIGKFAECISYSKNLYTEMLRIIDINQCYDSKNMKESTKSSSKARQNNEKLNNTLQKLQSIYKTYNILVNFGQKREAYQKRSIMLDQQDQSHDLVQQSQPLSSSSSVVVSQNPQHLRSYQKYRLKKLNQNLDLLVNFENKKLKSSIQMKSPQTTEPKQYISKPISTHVSRKISFNNSFSNSLKNSKFQ